MGLWHLVSKSFRSSSISLSRSSLPVNWKDKFPLVQHCKAIYLKYHIVKNSVKPTNAASSQNRNAPIVASSWLSWMSMLITCTDAVSTGDLLDNPENWKKQSKEVKRTLKEVALVYSTTISTYIQLLGHTLFLHKWKLHQIAHCLAGIFQANF